MYTLFNLSHQIFPNPFNLPLHDKEVLFRYLIKLLVRFLLNHPIIPFLRKSRTEYSWIIQETHALLFCTSTGTIASSPLGMSPCYIHDFSGATLYSQSFPVTPFLFLAGVTDCTDWTNSFSLITPSSPQAFSAARRATSKIIPGGGSLISFHRPPSWYGFTPPKVNEDNTTDVTFPWSGEVSRHIR